ncbi:MAG: DUF1446 domain-containing protein [Actinomycetia bacterium]|nr:DUF1446 domain-containing protein [Actinomycetes bacterium]
MSEAEAPTGISVLVPSGMLGSGVSAAAVQRGIELGAVGIAVDGGSTDSGPYYLGAATAKTTEQAVAHDLRILVAAAHGAGIPLIVGSCGTSGTDAGVDWIHAIVEQIASDQGLDLCIARIYSEQSAEGLVGRLRAGRIGPLPPAAPLDEATLHRCEHIVGLVGHEPIVSVLHGGADVVLAGRATDAAVLAAVPLMHGAPPGPTWHAAKTAECGSLCTTTPTGAGVLITIEPTGFTIEPLNAAESCTPTSVHAHMLYENADPFRAREPLGTIDTSAATYRALDDRRVRVEQSHFEPAEHPTMKLEGATLTGYQTVAIAGIRDPHTLAHIDTWTETLRTFLHAGIGRVLGLDPADYELELRCYGYNAVLGPNDPDITTTPREVGVVLIATADTQEVATTIAKYANPYLLHMPLPGESHLPSHAFMSSPAEMVRGPVYEFVLQHAVELDHPNDLVRIEVGSQ